MPTTKATIARATRCSCGLGLQVKRHRRAQQMCLLEDGLLQRAVLRDVLDRVSVVLKPTFLASPHVVLNNTRGEAIARRLVPG